MIGRVSSNPYVLEVASNVHHWKLEMVWSRRYRHAHIHKAHAYTWNTCILYTVTCYFSTSCIEWCQVQCVIIIMHACTDIIYHIKKVKLSLQEMLKKVASFLSIVKWWKITSFARLNAALYRNSRVQKNLSVQPVLCNAISNVSRSIFIPLLHGNVESWKKHSVIV